MKKLLFILLALCSPLFGQISTQKVNNTAVIYGANSTLTVNGNEFVSNLVVRGAIIQTGSGAGSSNLFLAQSNYVGGVIYATNNGGHRIGSMSFAFNSIVSPSTLTIAGTSVLLSPTTAGNVTTAIGFGLNVTNNLTVSNAFTAPSALATHQVGSLNILGLNIYGSGTGINVGGGGSGNVILHPSSQPVVVRGLGMTLTNNLSVSNSFTVGGTTQLGTNGSAFVFHKTATASLDFGNILAAGFADLTITVGGAAANDSVILGNPVDQDGSLDTEAFVSAANTVTVRAHNVGSIAVDQASKTYRVTVINY